MSNNPTDTRAPEVWAPAQAAAERLLKPLSRFLHIEAASGIVLLITATVALVWANSPLAESYDRLWHTPVTIALGPYVFSESLHFVINDGLMTIFFFVVGLEIRREIHEGELSDLKRASLPIAAAIGGMAAPALVYLALGADEVRHGWAVPTATDIAFAVGVLALLGKRVPPALRVLLLALAIIDDIGAILIIALFYSSGLVWSGLLVGVAGMAGIMVLQRFGVRAPLTYVAPSLVAWWGFWQAGVHPTIAGVVVGMLTPVRPWFGEQGFLATAEEVVHDFRRHASEGKADVHALLDPLRRIAHARREALAPVVRIQMALHPWVAFGIMPLFALANAGVSIGGISFDDPATTSIAVGVVMGLVLGKPLGILAVSFVTVKLGISALPRGIGWTGVLVVGAVAGIGFTMAIFIAGLAFEDPARLGVAKLGVLASSALAAIIGLTLGRVAFAARPVPGAAATVEEAEASTEQ